MELKEGDAGKIDALLSLLLKGGILQAADGADFLHVDENTYSRLVSIILEYRAADKHACCNLEYNENTKILLNAGFFSDLFEKQKRDSGRLDLEIDKLKKDKWMTPWAFGISIIAGLIGIASFVISLCK